MKISFPCNAVKGFAVSFVLLAGVFFCLVSTSHSATNKKPILISQAASTRAVAFESASFKAEPFSLNASIVYNNDPRTRICIFATDLELLPGEGANAFTSDIQDGTGKIYPLRVEYVGRVPDFPRHHDDRGPAC